MNESCIILGLLSIASLAITVICQNCKQKVRQNELVPEWHHHILYNPKCKDNKPVIE